MKRIGLVQTMSIGDIVIALPIAKWFADRGAEVIWPVASIYEPFLSPAAPYVSFIPVHSTGDAEELFARRPKAELQARGCDATYVLYNAMLGKDSLLQNPAYTKHLKFDEYKYAVAGVPFSEKWRLSLVRDMARENRLHASLEIRKPYVCVHRQSKDFRPNIVIPEEWRRNYQIVEIDERTDSPFDWIATLEGAAELLLIDSIFSNLVEQLNMPNDKSLVLRSRVELTPVMKNGWRFFAFPG